MFVQAIGAIAAASGSANVLYFASTCPSRAQSANLIRIINILNDVKEYSDDTRSLLEWSDWADKAAGRLRDGKAPSAAPGGISGGAFEKRLRDSIAKLRRLYGPTFTSVDFDFVKAAGLGGDELRAFLRSSVDALRIPKLEIQKAWQIVVQLKGAALLVEAQLRALRSVAEILLGLVGAPNYQLYVAIVAEVAAINETYIPLTEELKAEIEETQSTITGITRAAAEDLKNTAETILSSLHSEQRILEVEAEAIEARQSELDQKKVTLQEMVQNAMELQSQINRLEARVDAAELDIQQAEEDEASAISAEREAAERIESISYDLRRPYDLCPNHHPFDRCNHDDLKRSWSERVSNLRQNRLRRRCSTRLSAESGGSATTNRAAGESDSKVVSNKEKSGSGSLSGATQHRAGAIRNIAVGAIPSEGAA